MSNKWSRVILAIWLLTFQFIITCVYTLILKTWPIPLYIVQNIFNNIEKVQFGQGLVPPNLNPKIRDTPRFSTLNFQSENPMGKIRVYSLVTSHTCENVFESIMCWFHFWPISLVMPQPWCKAQGQGHNITWPQPLAKFKIKNIEFVKHS